MTPNSSQDSPSPARRAPRRVRCPKCSRLAIEKRAPRAYPDGKRYSMYIHAQENRGGFITVTDHCMVEVAS